MKTDYDSEDQDYLLIRSLSPGPSPPTTAPEVEVAGEGCPRSLLPLSLNKIREDLGFPLSSTRVGSAHLLPGRDTIDSAHLRGWRPALLGSQAAQ